MCAATNLKCSIIGWPVNAPSLSVTREHHCFGCLPALELDLALAEIGLDAVERRRKSECQNARRYSPSVIDFSPTASCFLMSASISRSSTAFSCAALISPRSRLRAGVLQRRRSEAGCRHDRRGRAAGTLHVDVLFSPSLKGKLAAAERYSAAASAACFCSSTKSYFTS